MSAVEEWVLDAEILRQALSSIKPPLYRLIFILILLGYHHCEIADVIGCTRQHISYIAKLGRDSIKQWSIENGYS